jgi:hypothetical protein
MAKYLKVEEAAAYIAGSKQRVYDPLSAGPADQVPGRLEGARQPRGDRRVPVWGARRGRPDGSRGRTAAGSLLSVEQDLSVSPQSPRNRTEKEAKKWGMTRTATTLGGPPAEQIMAFQLDARFEPLPLNKLLDRDQETPRQNWPLCCAAPATT